MWVSTHWGANTSSNVCALMAWTSGEGCRETSCSCSFTTLSHPPEVKEKCPKRENQQILCRESDKSDQALGGVGPIRFSHLLGGTGKGWQRRRHRPSELCSALGRHLPGQERAEVRGALAAMVGTGL